MKPLFALATIALVACARDAEQPRTASAPPAVQPQAVAAQPAAQQPAPPQPAVRVPLGPDSLELERDTLGLPLFKADAQLDTAAMRRRLAEVQQVADTATTEAVAAPALLRAGLLKLRLSPGAVHGDFDVLLERFPSSTFSDDAAYAKTFFETEADCEGSAACHIHTWVGRDFAFLASDATSPYVPIVVERINRALVAVLAPVTDYAVRSEDYEPTDVRGRILAYDSLARELPEGPRESARRLTDSLLTRFRVDGWRDYIKAPLSAALDVPCTAAEALFGEVPGTGYVSRDEGRFSDPAPMHGCRVATIGYFEKLGNAAGRLPAMLAAPFEAHGWTRDSAQTLEHLRGARIVLRRERVVCQVKVAWMHHPDSAATAPRGVPGVDGYGATILCADSAP